MALVSVVDARFGDGSDEYTVPDGEWITRGWTLQEQLFSKSYLVFTEKQIYWHCSHDRLYVEETSLEDVPIEDVPRIQIKNWAPRTTLLRDDLAEDEDACRDKYQELVAMYSRRSLTFKSDMLNAFAGVMDNLSKHEWAGNFLWGLPEHPFSAALLWSVENQTRHFATHTVASEDGTSVRKIPLPSWSWAAWNTNGPRHEWIEYNESYLDYMTELSDRPHPEISFYRVGIDSKLVKVNEKSVSRVTTVGDEDRTALWKGLASINEGVLQAPNAEWIDSGQLRFRTSITALSIRRSESRHREGHIIVFHDPLNNENGTEYDRSWLELRLGSTAHLRGCGMPAADAFPDVEFTRVDDGLPNEVLNLDLIIIGRSHSRDQFLSALVVEWEDGVAYRLGLAHVREDLWVTFERRWKLVTLG